MNDHPMSPLSSAANNALMSLRNHSSTHSSPGSGVPGAPVAPNYNTSSAIQPSSVINLSNSSDVVIGPMTQYQGPVTIYQYMDATVEARSLQANGGGITQNRTNATSTTVQSLSRSSKIAIALVIALVLVVGLMVYLEVWRKKYDGDKDKGDILFGNNYESGIFPNLGNGHLVVEREQWGAGTANLSRPLEHPIPYVLITHIGVQSNLCYNIYKCSIKMRTIQDSAIAEKGLPDISSNFYVGSDGNVYVGRGWNHANTYANNTLAITFMGDFIRYTPDPRQLEAVQYLLAYGLTKKHLALDYKLVAQNQTKTTKSPGAYVYKEIIKWPHWYACGINDNPKCGVELGMPTVWDAKQ